MSSGSNNFGVDTDAIQLFARNLSLAIDKYGEITNPQERYAKQKLQMETLVALEKEFRRTLISHSKGNYVYRRFVRFICEEKRNILAARPFFRERQKLFTLEISKALKKRSEKSLYKFHVNFQFVLFTMKCRVWKPKSRVTLLYRQIDALRREILETNMPLALNRARMFFSKTPAAHLTYMDFVQISSEGMMSGIDKYVLPFSSNFRAVLIGRMLGNFIENYSETLLHFYPVDKRKIYRGNKSAGKHVNGIDRERLAQEVNKDVKDNVYKTTPDEISSLMAAASCVSADSGTVQGLGRGDDELDVPKLVDRFEAPADTRPDVRVEEHDALVSMHNCIEELDLREKKLLRMWGVSSAPAVV
jgi:DNA-directed RNA polymerase specialized sigma subunit